VPSVGSLSIGPSMGALLGKVIPVCTPTPSHSERATLHVIKAKGICRHPWLTRIPTLEFFSKAFFHFRFGKNVISSFG
jgi:hypothetical protein